MLRTCNVSAISKLSRLVLDLVALFTKLNLINLNRAVGAKVASTHFSNFALRQ